MRPLTGSSSAAATSLPLACGCGVCGVSDVTAESGNSEMVQGANLTYLRHALDYIDHPVLKEEVERACDDIEGYRELVGLVISRDDPERLKNFLKVMTWGNGFTEEDYDSVTHDRVRALSGPQLFPVRRWASSTVHVAQADAEWLTESVWVGPPFQSITTPLVTRCGARLNGSVHSPIVVMRVDSSLCARCRRLTNLVHLANVYPDRVKS